MASSKLQPQSATAGTALEGRAKRGASRYDYVKVRVRIENHYHVLSRFLVSRLLCASGLPPQSALRIALQLKKELVDRGALDIPLDELNEELFRIVRRHGFAEEYVERYRQTMRFYQHRKPMLVLLGGPGCLAMPSLASKLAERLNLSTVLRTEVVYSVIQEMTGELGQTRIWHRKFESSDALEVEFERECALVRLGLAGDVNKATNDGKAIIIEGVHLSVQHIVDIVLGVSKADEGSNVRGVAVPIFLNLPDNWVTPCVPSSSGLRGCVDNPATLEAIRKAQVHRARRFELPVIDVNAWDLESAVEQMYRVVMSHMNTVLGELSTG